MKEPTLVAVTLIGVLLIATAPGQAAPINLSASSVFNPTGGGNDNNPDTFTVTNSSDPGVQISQILITLQSPLFFDTADGGSGVSGFNPFVAVNGATVGFSGASVDDGGTTLTATFTQFDPSEVFTFTIDVDRGNGSGDQNVNANQFDGPPAPTIEFTFLGPFVGSPLTSSPPSPYSQTGSTATANFQGQAEMSDVIPEPASLLLWSVMGVGALVGGRRFLRRSSENAA